MNKNYSPYRCLLLLLAFLSSGMYLYADDVSDSLNARLREALRAQAQQLQTAQDQLSSLQADKVVVEKANSALEAKNQDLQAKIEALKKETSALKATADSKISDLEVKNAILQRVVDDRELKNLKLFQTGNEILTRYEKFSLGDALTAKEPFTKLTRVKLENLVQGYQDKLYDNKTVPGTVPPLPQKGPNTSTSADSSSPSSAKIIVPASSSPSVNPVKQTDSSAPGAANSVASPVEKVISK